MLTLNNICTGYNKKQVLFELSMNVTPGEIIGIIGPNGAGKSTILKAICGLLSVWQGEITYKGKNITGKSPAEIIRHGVTFAPQGNRVFDEMTVMENLEIGGYILKKKQFKTRLEIVLDIFPLLKDKLKKNAGNLSGGEQQILALGRALMPEPDLLLLDEPSLGLAPNLLDALFSKLREINQDQQCAMLIVEQKVMDVLEISDKVYSVKLGKVAFKGKPSELQGNHDKLKELFL